MTSIVKKILLAEHEKNIEEILTYLLKAWDYTPIIARDGENVLGIVRREQPDIIIIDSNLPKIDGLKISKSLKEDFLTAHIPIIVLIDKRQIRKKMLEIEQGVDDYILKPPDPIDLEVRLEMALRRTAHQLHANALTRLPGNRQIEKIIQSKLEDKSTFSVAYYDIDNFKSFNDKYGYMKGDNVIRHTAHIISTTVKKYGNKYDFVGHIGGDDFVVVTTPDRDSLIASESISDFARLIPFHYNKLDREKGCVVTKDRRGNISEIPLMSISIAIANNKECNLQNIVDFMEIIVEIKRYLKTLPGSNFLINRRKPSKKEFIIDPNIDTTFQKTHKIDLRFNYKPLGQILLESNIITSQQLEISLNKHWNTGRKIGQSIVDLGMASIGDIARALESQLNVPHFDIKDFDKTGELKSFMHKIPFDVMKDYGIIPVNREKQVLSIVMINPKNSEAINKIKTLTGCNVATFFVLEDEFGEILERAIKKADKGI